MRNRYKRYSILLVIAMVLGFLFPVITNPMTVHAEGKKTMVISMSTEDISVGDEFTVILTSRYKDDDGNWVKVTSDMKFSFDKSLMTYLGSNAESAAIDGNTVTATGQSVKFKFKAIKEGTFSIVAYGKVDGESIEAAGIRITIKAGEGGEEEPTDDPVDDPSDDPVDDPEDGEDEEPVITDVKNTAEYKALKENYSKLYDKYNLIKEDKRKLLIATIVAGALSLILLIVIIILLISRRRDDDDEYVEEYYEEEPKKSKKPKKNDEEEMVEEAPVKKPRREVKKDFDESDIEEPVVRKALVREEAPRHERRAESDDYLERQATKSEQADVDLAREVARIMAMRTSKLASPDQVESLVKDDVRPTPANVSAKNKNQNDDFVLMDIDDL